MRRKKVVISRKEVALIILTIVGAVALYAWQTYRMASMMLSPSARGSSAASEKPTSTFIWKKPNSQP